jgi:uracil-DNA glycosylase
VRCAPPGNKPAPDEFEKCRRFLYAEVHFLRNIRVVIGLGKIAFDHYLKACRMKGPEPLSPTPKFGHGAVYLLPWGVTLLGSYHPSQQNTFTGRLTRSMFHSVFQQARTMIEEEKRRSG